MITPVTFIIAIDGSVKLRKHIADISQFVESVLDMMLTNDDLGFVLITDVTNILSPLAIIRPHNQKNLKQDILKELASQDGTSGGHPSKTIFLALDLLSKRSYQDQWRPTKILLITDGHLAELNMPQLWDPCMISQDLVASNDGSIFNQKGPVFLDVYVFSKHHVKKDFEKAMKAFNPKTTVLRIRGKIDLVKSVWHFRDRVSQARNSVQISDIPGSSLARRRNPGHVRIPSIFKK